MTESQSSFKPERHDAPLTKVSTVGRVLPHTEIKIIHPGTDQIIGETGELCTRGLRNAWLNGESKQKKLLTPLDGCIVVISDYG
jgi:acyl-CoA synthetase (AMP-forming)/AMP-acid ligase II